MKHISKAAMIKKLKRLHSDHDRELKSVQSIKGKWYAVMVIGLIAIIVLPLRFLHDDIIRIPSQIIALGIYFFALTRVQHWDWVRYHIMKHYFDKKMQIIERVVVNNGRKTK